MRNDVLTIFEGLGYSQARTFRSLVIPVLSELRSCVITGEPLLVIDLTEAAQDQAKPTATRRALKEKVTE